MALGWLAGDAGDEVEVLVQVQDGEPPEFSSGAISKSGIDGARCWPLPASASWTGTARSSSVGIMYSTGIAETGGAVNTACYERSSRSPAW